MATHSRTLHAQQSVCSNQGEEASAIAHGCGALEDDFAVEARTVTVTAREWQQIEDLPPSTKAVGRVFATAAAETPWRASVEVEPLAWVGRPHGGGAGSSAPAPRAARMSKKEERLFAEAGSS